MCREFVSTNVAVYRDWLARYVRRFLSNVGREMIEIAADKGTETIVVIRPVREWYEWKIVKSRRRRTKNDAIR